MAELTRLKAVRCKDAYWYGKMLVELFVDDHGFPALVRQTAVGYMTMVHVPEPDGPFRCGGCRHLRELPGGERGYKHCTKYSQTQMVKRNDLAPFRLPCCFDADGKEEGEASQRRIRMGGNLKEDAV